MPSALLPGASGQERSAPADNLWLAWVPAGLATPSGWTDAATARTGRALTRRVRLGVFLAALGLEDSAQGLDHSARPQALSLVWLPHLVGHRCRDQAGDGVLRALCARSPHH